MIRFAKENDISNIMKFIDEYWRKNHIVSRDKALFEFQHKWDDEISFVLSEKEGDITGVLGFIPYGKTHRDVTLVIWKTNKTEDTMQGINILSFLRDNGDIRTISAPGINPKTISIYKFLGLRTGKMKQWYRLRGVKEYKIAKVTNATIPMINLKEKPDVDEIKDFACLENEFGIDDCIIRDRQLIKSKEYLRRRYFEHPTFEYIKYGVKLDGKKLFVVLRVQKFNGSGLLRVIDCIGDNLLFRLFTSEIDHLMKKYDCEYADCYETGVDDDTFIEGGWLAVDDSGNIMPDYFAPFEQRNIEIFYMSQIERVILFKGDGDMDRPN